MIVKNDSCLLIVLILIWDASSGAGDIFGNANSVTALLSTGVTGCVNELTKFTTIIYVTIDKSDPRPIVGQDNGSRLG